MIKPSVILLTAALLTACGGGGSSSQNDPVSNGSTGGGSSSQNDPVSNGSTDDSPAETPATQPEVPSFVKRSITINAPVTNYPIVDNSSVSYLCEDPTTQSVIPVDINNDKYKDFIVHYWCGYNPTVGGLEQDTYDSLVAHVSNDDGTYRVANQEVFGQENPELGAMSRKYRRSDINGDGRDDFAFAMNREDGRDGSDEFYVRAQPAMLMSKPNNQYEVVRIGEADWGHAVGIVKNANGTKDVVFAGYSGGVPTQAFRYEDDGFVEVTDEYANTGRWANHFEALDEGGVTEYIAAAAGDPSKGAQFELFTKTPGVAIDTNNPASSFSFKTEFYVTVNGIGNHGYEFPVVEVNGDKVFGPAIFSMCQVENFGNGLEDVLVVRLAGFATKEGRESETNDYVADDMSPKSILTFFEYKSGTLKLINRPVMINENVNSNYNFMDCEDFNNDGLTDIVTSPFVQDGQPDVYLNNGNGELVRKDVSNLPDHSGNGSVRGQLEDVNNDGIADYMTFGQNTAHNTGTIEIHLLNEEL